MPRRNYRRRSNSSSNETAGFLGLLLVCLIGAVYFNLSPQDKPLFIAAGVGLVLLLILAGIMLALRRKELARRKAQALNIVDIDAMSGLDFERYLAMLLQARGYTNVKLTEAYDYGVDLIADKDGVRWGIQAKRYKSMVKQAAVEQVVTGLKHYGCQRAMVITNSTHSRRALEQAASNDCVLVGKEELAGWMVEFQNNHTMQPKSYE